MSNIQTSVKGYSGYRGREGQWGFLLHRLTGLGTLLFLIIHIVDTAMVYFRPEVYIEVMNVYRTTLFGLGEIGLVFAVFFHGVNGLRIALFDMFATRGWLIPTERRSAQLTMLVTLMLWGPAALLMLRNILVHNFGLFGGG